MANAAPSLLFEDRPSRLALALGKLLTLGHWMAGRHRYDDYRLERVDGMQILVLPSVANPKVLRTGAFFASQLGAVTIPAGAEVLDLGTGSGICALFAARHAGRVVATDINPAAIRCARINAAINGLDGRIDLREGDLFEPVAGQRFDRVLFNPPFYLGEPKNYRDAAWRSMHAAEHFAAELGDHLRPGAEAFVLLSSFGDACPKIEASLMARGFGLDIVARKRFLNESLTIVRARRGSRVAA